MWEGVGAYGRVLELRPYVYYKKVKDIDYE